MFKFFLQRSIIIKEIEDLLIFKRFLFRLSYVKNNPRTFRMHLIEKEIH